jgi:hypothetical protein
MLYILPKAKQTRFHSGNIPKECNICHKPITNFFSDTATTMGPWAHLCYGCTDQFSTGIGTAYELLENGWYKTRDSKYRLQESE